MIERYARTEMKGIWSEDGKFRRWLDVEIAVCEVLAERGDIPAAAAAVIRRDERLAFVTQVITLLARDGCQGITAAEKQRLVQAVESIHTPELLGNQ